jgi:hypothetical protein
MKLRLLVLLLVVLVVSACGGGGGGGGVSTPATVVGRVLNVSTGGPINPAATIQVGSITANTAADGSFQILVPQGTSELLVNTPSFGAWRFTISAATGTTDAGDLWVGPSRVTVTGRTIDAANSAPIANATVNFGGRRGLTNSVGTFSLSEVAYDPASQVAFWGIRGEARATGFFQTSWSAQPNVAVSGRVIVADVLMTRTSSDVPPPLPFNLWGRVAPAANAPGSIATLKRAGTPVRVYNVGSDNTYYFWVEPGTYTVEITKGTLTGTGNFNLTAPNQVIRQDVTLN